MSETTTVWHPYPEDKPKVPGRYLITMKYPSYENNEDLSDTEVVIGSWDCKRFYISASDKNVLAWAESPEPYRPEGEIK